MRTPHILFIAPTRIGDVVLSCSVLRHVVEANPGARITIVTSTLSAPLLMGCPGLERMIAIQKRSYNRHWLEVWRKTVGTRWDAVWDLRGSLVSHALRTRRLHWFKSSKAPIPKAQQYAQLFGTGPLPHPILWPLAENIAEAKRLLPEGEQFIAFAPIANWEPKEWPMENFIALARALLSGEFKGHRPVVICAAHERPRMQPFLQAMAAFHPVDLTDGSISLLSVYACLARCRGFVGNDSGLMHMAAASGTATMGLYGPTPTTTFVPHGPRTDYLAAPNGNWANLPPARVAAAFIQLVSRN